jgi:hypothetical protein
VGGKYINNRFSLLMLYCSAHFSHFQEFSAMFSNRVSIQIFGMIGVLLFAGQATAAGVPTVGFDPQKLPVLSLTNEIIVYPGNYKEVGMCRISKVTIEVSPQAGGTNGGSVDATYLQNQVWGGTAAVGGAVADILISNQGGGAFPVGKYNVQAKAVFTKPGQSITTYKTWSKYYNLFRDSHIGSEVNRWPGCSIFVTVHGEKC